MKKSLWLILALSLCATAGCGTAEQARVAEPATSQPEARPEHSGHHHSSEEAANEAAAVKKSGLAADLAAGESKTYGAEFSVEGAPISLALALEKAADSDGPYKIAATIEKVCQKRGCWFTLKGDGVQTPVRVRMKEYSFFVARNTAGAQAVVEGTLKPRTIPAAQAQHFAEDAAAGSDQPAPQIREDQVGWEMTIVAAKITNHG